MGNGDVADLTPRRTGRINSVTQAKANRSQGCLPLSEHAEILSKLLRCSTHQIVST